MINLLNAFCSGLCSAATIYSFKHGHIGLALMNLGFAITNAMLAVHDVRRKN
jgi:hypothetical protein